MLVHDLYSYGKDEDSQANQLRIVETAAKRIKNDIKYMQAKEEYSTPAEMKGEQENIEYAPESLVHLLRENIEYVPESLVHLLRENIEYVPESLVHLLRENIEYVPESLVHLLRENIEYVPESLVHLLRENIEYVPESLVHLLRENIEYVPESLVHLLRENIEYVPESLVHLLRVLLSGKDIDLKLPSLGQALIQASRPRTLMPPLQLGLGVQLHHHFVSKCLIQSLNLLGFCCSYAEVQKYERAAAKTLSVNNPGFASGHFVQFVADNVDHNSRTLDGMNTFHGMGITAAVSPGIKTCTPIPRVTVSAEDIAAVGRINIHHFSATDASINDLVYQRLPKVDVPKMQLPTLTCFGKRLYYCVHPDRVGLLSCNMSSMDCTQNHQIPADD